jgi:large subunit ribosomal protein L3
MTADWDKWGRRVPLTVLKLEDVQVMAQKTDEKDGYTALQVGAGPVKVKNMTKPLLGHFARCGVSPKAKVAEFRVSQDALLEPGTTLTAQHFVPGQYVDITGTSQGKGFQGVMKMYGFGGQPASHGVSKTHRSLGSTGQCQDPGRVFKGKKMPGRMGGRTVTTPRLRVYKIDVKRNLVYIIGSVPGKSGSYVKVADAVRNKWPAMPHFPTYSGEGYVPAADAWSVQELYEAEAEGHLPSTAVGEAPFEVIMSASDEDPFAIHEWEEGEGK